jgi:hypothetical protein
LSFRQNFSKLLGMRKKYSELTNDQKIRVRARSYANVYQARGELEPEPCRRCGERAQKHHPDYSCPLFVQWLCKKCHRAFHAVERAAQMAEFSSHISQLLRSLP